MAENELLLAISNMMDEKMQIMKTDLESQIKQTEHILKNEIQKESTLLLDEIERVHAILDKHKADTTKHTA